MVEIDYRSFVIALVIGLPICSLAWYFTRSKMQASWRWRFAFCLLVALSFCPSLPFSPHGPRSLVRPAAGYLPAVAFGIDGLLVALLFGVLPILLAALGLFAISWLWRRRITRDSG
jgi:hypothetical protein